MITTLRRCGRCGHENAEHWTLPSEAREGHCGVCGCPSFEEAPDIMQAVMEGLSEVSNLIDEGRVPDTLQTFEELHDYIDANELAGLTESRADWPKEKAAIVQELMDRQIRALAKDVSKTRYHVRWDLETWSADAGPFTGSSTMHPDAGVVTIEAADWADAGDTVDNLMDVDFLVNGDPGSMGHTDGWVSCEEPDLDENEREAIGWGRCTFHPRVIETVSVEPHTHDLRPSGGLMSCVTCGWIPSDDELDEPTIDDGTRAALIVTAELAGFGVLTQEQREQIDTRLLSEGGARS